MKLTRKMLATSVIAAAGAIPLALGLSATAVADPVAAPAPVPSVPGLPFLQQLASNPAAATQLMQGLTSMLGTAQAAAPAAVTPPPAATASVTLPQPPATLPGATAPLNIPAAPASPATTPASGQSTTPALPFVGDLAKLMPAGTPLAGLLPTSAPATAPAPAAAPAASAPAGPSMLMPLSALP